jgi:hypothetical protein
MDYLVKRFGALTAKCIPFITTIRRIIIKTCSKAIDFLTKIQQQQESKIKTAEAANVKNKLEDVFGNEKVKPFLINSYFFLNSRNLQILFGSRSPTQP